MRKIRRFVDMMGQSLKNLLKPTIKGNTILFPKEHVPLPFAFRGAPYVDEEKCTICRTCEQICSSRTIQIFETEDLKIFNLSFNLAQCIYCGMCQYQCPENAIFLLDSGSNAWLLADFTLDSMQRSWFVEKRN